MSVHRRCTICDLWQNGVFFRELLSSLGFEGRSRCTPGSKIFCKSLILWNFVEVVGCKGPRCPGTWYATKICCKARYVYSILASFQALIRLRTAYSETDREVIALIVFVVDNIAGHFSIGGMWFCFLRYLKGREF